MSEILPATHSPFISPIGGLPRYPTSLTPDHPSGCRATTLATSSRFYRPGTLKAEKPGDLTTTPSSLAQRSFALTAKRPPSLPLRSFYAPIFFRAVSAEKAAPSPPPEGWRDLGPADIKGEQNSVFLPLLGWSPAGSHPSSTETGNFVATVLCANTRSSLSFLVRFLC